VGVPVPTIIDDPGSVGGTGVVDFRGCADRELRSWR
jgi:hypothetical protein